MTDTADRRADAALAVQVVVQAVVFFAFYSLVGDPDSDFTAKNLIVLAVLFAVVVALVGLAQWRQTRRAGGRAQLRAFGRALSTTGVVPADADRPTWRRRLLAVRASSRPWRIRVQWFAFALSMGAAQAFARRETGWISLGGTVVIGLVIGLVLGQVMVSLSRDRMARAQELLDQIDDELTRDPA